MVDVSRADTKATMDPVADQPNSVRTPFRPRRRPGATAVLTIYLATLVLIPAPLTVPALGSAGSPATILALGAFFWWVWFHIQRSGPLHRSFQFLRAAVLAWLLIMVVVYAHAMTAPVPFDEVSPADSAMLRVVGLSGVVLMTADGITSLEGIRMIVRRLGFLAGVVAILGIVQFATDQLYVDLIRIPGLSAGTASWTLGDRNGLTRISGTSTSPIEFGVLLALALPLLIQLARVAPRWRWLYRAMSAVVVLSMFLSISRSTIVCAAMGMLVLAWGWPLSTKLRAVPVALALGAVAYVTVPGLLGTIGKLFSGASEDSSISSRTGSYDLAYQFFETSPVLGRGFGTFLPKYWILDNGYLGLLIEAGVIGLLSLLTVFLAGWVAARPAIRKAADPVDREIARGLLASLAAGAFGFAFFDMFAFPQAVGCLFVILGLLGAAGRLAPEEALSRSHDAQT